LATGRGSGGRKATRPPAGRAPRRAVSARRWGLFGRRFEKRRLAIGPGSLGRQKDAPPSPRGRRPRRRFLHRGDDEDAVLEETRRPELAGLALEERETRERRVARAGKNERLGEPFAELAPARGRQPVLASRWSLFRPAAFHRDEAAAQETTERGIDLRQLGVPSERRISLHPVLEVPAAGGAAREEPEKDVRERHGNSIKVFPYRGAKRGGVPVEYDDGRRSSSGGRLKKRKGARSAPVSRKYLN